MTGRFEQDVKRAWATFIAEVCRSAQREAIESIGWAFAEVIHQVGDAVADAGVPPPPPTDHRDPQPAPAAVSRPVDLANVRDRLVASLRETPGQTTAQLRQSLDIQPTKLRRYLRKLADDGAIRIEDTPVSGAVLRHAYYVAEPSEPTSGARSESTAIPAEVAA